MPGHVAVEDGQGLGDVEMQPFVWRKRPEPKVQAVRYHGYCQGRQAADDDLPNEDQQGLPTERGGAVECQPREGEGENRQPDEDVGRA